MKKFVKATDEEGSGFAFLLEKFLKISMEKRKAGIFDSPQIRELIKDPIFDEVSEVTEVSRYKLPGKPL